MSDKIRQDACNYQKGHSNKVVILEDLDDPRLVGHPIDATQALTDEQLKTGGLVPIKAYVHTSKTKEALRSERSRIKKEENGLKQTGVTVPDHDEHRQAMRSAAKALRENRMTPAELINVVTPPANDDDFPFSREMILVRQILIKGGFKAWCIRRVLAWR